MTKNCAFRSMIIAALFSNLAPSARCQVVIADTNLVARLQLIVPNALSGNVLDENHPDVLAVDTLNLSNSMIDDLSGIEHFINATYLNIGGNGATALAAWPPALLHITGNNNYFPLPPLPVGLQRLNISFSNITALPALPATLTWLRCTATWLAELPPLPVGLDTMDCSRNLLTSLPPLPDGLLWLSCGLNDLGTLPALPASLRWLSCAEGELTQLPALPDALEWLEVGRNHLAELPTALPGQLKDLRCYDNDLTTLPPLPFGLRSIIAHMNDLVVLPALPPTIQDLTLGTNQLTALPALPDSLVELDVHLNQLISLPTIPSGLEELNCADNPGLLALPELPEGFRRAYINGTAITCVPLLPSSLQWLYAYNAPVTCVPNRPAGANVSNLPVCNVATSPCPVASPFITGHAFFDANGNGVKDPGEPPCPSTVIEASPTGDLSGCDANGYYAMPMDTGSYVVDGHAVVYHTISTPSQPATLPTLMSVDSLNDIGYQPIPGIYDLMAHNWATAARPGFGNNAYLLVRNNGTEATTVDVQLDFDTDQTWDSSNVAPTTLAGNAATWTLTSLVPGAEWQAVVYLHTADTVPLGTPVQHTITALPALPDTTPGDNLFVHNAAIIGSWDPNAKSVVPEHLSLDELALDDHLTYTLQFQNTGTYYAVRVVITDTLPPDLLSNSVQFVASSHTCSWYVSNRVLHVIYDPIQLPDSTSNEPESHGFFQFIIRPVAGLLPDSEIRNTANIHFDHNEAVITEPAVFTVEFTTSLTDVADAQGVHVRPVPARDFLQVTIIDGVPLRSAEVIALDGRTIVLPIGSSGVVDVRTVAAGAYVLRITDAQGRPWNTRFVKE